MRAISEAAGYEMLFAKMRLACAERGVLLSRAAFFDLPTVVLMTPENAVKAMLAGADAMEPAAALAQTDKVLSTSVRLGYGAN